MTDLDGRMDPMDKMSAVIAARDAEIERLRHALTVIQGWAGPRGDDEARRGAWADNMDRIYELVRRTINK